MSKSTDSPRFVFHGNAMPLGGRVLAMHERPALGLIKGPPAGALTVAGGWSVAATRGSQHGDWLKWGVTVADCKGELRPDGHYITTVTSSVADLQAKNDPHLFEAGHLRITMVSDHDGPDSQPKIVSKEILFDDLRLDGHPIIVNYDSDLASFPTLNELESEYQSNRDLFTKYQTCLTQAGEANFGDSLPRNASGYVVASFVRSIEWNGNVTTGHVLYVKDFGSLYFGEVLINADNRRVTLLRLELGCTIKATVACAEADPNGIWA